MVSSTKAASDIDWNDAEQKNEALHRLCAQLERLNAWIQKRRPETELTPLSHYIEALVQVKQQDLETVAEGEVRIRQGVAEDRRVSIGDAEMRHGRKSKSKRFKGYKQHISTHLDAQLVLDRKSTRLNSSHSGESRMPSSA